MAVEAWQTRPMSLELGRGSVIAAAAGRCWWQWVAFPSQACRPAVRQAAHTCTVHSGLLAPPVAGPGAGVGSKDRSRILGGRSRGEGQEGGGVGGRSRREEQEGGAGGRSREQGARSRSRSRVSSWWRRWVVGRLKHPAALECWDRPFKVSLL